ncbi:MAG: PQQ-binding-like beta-propeller repeat protein [bacterium]
MFVTPEVSGELLYVGSCSGKFYALDTVSGEMVWRYDIQQDGDQTRFPASASGAFRVRSKAASHV